MDDLRGIDLNLIVVLDAILTERNLTRAGEAIGLTQPAVSGAAAKLRKLLDDPILIRTGRTSELTPKARALQPVVHEAVTEIGRTLNLRPLFDPRTTARQFRLTASDYALAFMAAPLLEVLEQEAPNVSVEFAPLNNLGPIDLLREDVAIASSARDVPGKRQALFSDTMVCVVRQGHPSLRDGALSLDALATLPYVQVNFADGVVMYADDALSAAGVTPRVARSVPGFLPVPFAVAGTDMFGFVPARLAEMYAPSLGLVTAAIPVQLPVLIESAFWHPSRTSDPALQWLLGILRQVAERVEFAADAEAGAL
ncbi:LysR family transcriptional regulator [Microbacterium fluvii]|uniref:LysR family transcriptional regulator n=1 Tax=Microbacterium fluvii TaxID=415215 RepID=A0ABW2HGM3_9MICO|nr:LysR family transcriptional regulator [Microbacterium fluvii]MCU4673204.1 LysR family transcriptional regulator [Microbacterium fluvii]